MPETTPGRFHLHWLSALTLAEAAAIAGVTPQTLKQAALAGTLKARNPSGRLWVTTEAAVRDGMASRRRGRPAKRVA